MAKYLSRKDWGSKPRRPQDIVAMRLPAKNLYFHHTVTPVTADAKADTRTVEKSVYNKYIAIPYSGLVHPDDKLYEAIKDGVVDMPVNPDFIESGGVIPDNLGVK